MIQITCKGNSAICTRKERLTSGMVGLQCEFVFDGAWDGLARTAVFWAGNEKRDVLLTSDTCTVPWEVLKTAGYQLVIGVYGTNAEGTLVIPTVYAMCGGIASGADPSGDESVEPTQTLVEQIMAAAGTAVETANAVKAAADAGDFKGDKGDKGDAPTDEQVASSVEAWLDAHPEATTTVADGSINPDKTTWMRKAWHNIFDVSTITDGYFFYTGSNDNTTGGGTADYFVSDYIPVVAGREYVFSHKNMELRWTDDNKTFISGTASGISVAGQKVTAPDGVAFVRFSLKKAGLTPEEVQAQVYEYIGDVLEYDTYKNLYSIVVTDAGYSKAISDIVEGKFVDGSLAPADLFADESILYKQMKGWDEFHWNLVDADKLEEGTINKTTGTDAPTPNSFIHRRTPYMPVTPGETLFWMWSDVYGYDADKNFVSAITQTSGIGVVPDGVYFIRATKYGNNVDLTINIYRRGYGQNELSYDSEYPYSHGFPVFKDEDSKDGFECYLGIHPWADKNFSIIGDSFTAPSTWCNIMRGNLKAASLWNHAISGGAFSDYDGVPKTAYEQAQEMVTNGDTPDVILITMGTNDANNSRTIGDIVQSNSISDFDLTTYTGGMQACLNYLQNNFPNAIIYVGWTPMGGLVNGTKAEYITRMQEVCLMYGVEYIETRTCGVTRFSDVYADCYENGVNGGHPTGVGQQKIGAYMTRLMQSKM